MSLDGGDAGFEGAALKRRPEQIRLGKHFDDEIGCRSDEPSDEDDPEPDGTGPSAPKEMHECDDLDNEAPRVEQVAQESHRKPPGPVCAFYANASQAAATAQIDEA